MSQNFSKNPSEPMEKKFSTYDKSSRNNYHSSRRLKGASRHKFSVSAVLSIFFFSTKPNFFFNFTHK